MNITHRNGIGHTARGPGVAFFILLLAISIPATAFAQQCGTGSGQGQNISACAGELLEEQGRTIDLLDQMTQQMGAMGILQVDQMNAANRQLGFMRASQQRGRNDKADTTDEEFDSLVARGTPEECEHRLLPRFAPGGPPPRPICTDEEIADNKCQEVCEFTEQQKNRNTQRGQRLEAGLVDALEQTKRANDELDEELHALSVMAFQTLSASSNACNFANPHPNLAPFSAGYLVTMNVLDNTQQMLTAIGKDICQHDVAGFNTSSACIPFSVLEGLSKGLHGLVGTVNGNYSAAKIDATFECVQRLQTSAGEQEAQLHQMESKVDHLTTEVNDLKLMLGEVKQLLNTPQGQRSDFPSR
jgi:hypothetical protein